MHTLLLAGLLLAQTAGPGPLDPGGVPINAGGWTTEDLAILGPDPSPAMIARQHCARGHALPATLAQLSAEMQRAYAAAYSNGCPR